MRPKYIRVRARSANAGSGTAGWSLAGPVPACFLMDEEVMIGVSRTLERSLRSCAALRHIADYRRAADLRIGALRERRATDRRVSVRAASNRAASAAKAGVGPFQRNWSTLLNRAMSVRRVASVRKSKARSRSRERVSARALALAAFTRHSRLSKGMDSRWTNLARMAADDFAPQPGSPG